MMVVVGATAEAMLPDALKRSQTPPKHSPTLSDTQKRSWEAPRTLPNALRRSKMLRDAPSTYQMLARRFQTFPAPSRSAPNAPKCLRRHQLWNTTRTTNKSATVCTTRKQQQNDRRQALQKILKSITKKRNEPKYNCFCNKNFVCKFCKKIGRGFLDFLSSLFQIFS